MEKAPNFPVFGAPATEPNVFKRYGMGSVDDGMLIPPSGRKHLVLFDCTDEENRGPIDTDFGKVNSPIIANFLKTLVTDEKTDVYIETWSPVSEELQPKFQRKKTGNLVQPFLNVFRGDKQQDDKLCIIGAQISRAYRYLVQHYEIDSAIGFGGTRDTIYLLGDGEGALAANAVARIIADVGVVQDFYPMRIPEMINEHGYPFAEEGTPDEGQRSIWCRYAYVALVGLWYDDTSQTKISPVVSDGKYIGRVAKYARMTCNPCREAVRTGNVGHCDGSDKCSALSMARALQEALIEVKNDLNRHMATGEPDEQSVSTDLNGNSSAAQRR